MAVKKHTHKTAHSHLSIRTRAVRQYVFFAFAMVFVLSIVTFLVAKALIEQRTLSQLAMTLTSKQTTLEQSIQADRERTVLLASRAELQNVVQFGGSDQFLDSVVNAMRAEHIPVVGIQLMRTDGSIVATRGEVVGNSGLTHTTRLFPIVDDEGWNGHTIVTPVRGEDRKVIGALAVRYDVRERLRGLLDVSAMGQTAELLLGRADGGNLVLLHHAAEVGQRPIVLGKMEEYWKFDSPLAHAVQSEEGIGEREDYRGQKVFAAYRTVPSLGWGMVVKINNTEVVKGVRSLFWLLGVMGLLVAVGGAFIAYFLTVNLTEPILQLGRKMEKLGPDHWGYRRSVQTGDELELLDSVAHSMAKRLKRVYTNLEGEVQERTKELREQYIKDHAILEAIEHGVLTIDTNGTVIDANSAAEKILTKKSLQNLSIEQVLLVCNHGELCSHRNNPVTLAIKNQKIFRAGLSDRVNIVREDMSLVPINIVVTPLKHGKKSLGAVAVFQDISEERRVDYIKSEFISLASHQLRTPVSTMQWYLEIFKNDAQSRLSKAQRESIEEMQIAAERMHGLVESLLHTAKLDGQSIEPQVQNVDIQNLFQELFDEFYSTAQDAGVNSAITFPKKKVILKTDPVLLRIIFQNLFTNAVKYSKKGTVIQIQLRTLKRSLEIRVQDTGIGIPDTAKKNIFQRFYRANNAARVDTTGSGLGLYITKKILDVLKGSIRFESTEGKGTTFIVKLPL